jgi:predicted metal-binding membrane protein
MNSIAPRGTSVNAISAVILFTTGTFEFTTVSKSCLRILTESDF